MLRVVVADDHHFFREGVREMLAAEGLKVVGEAMDGAGAMALARELKPDIVVLDLRCQGLGHRGGERSSPRARRRRSWA